jgi:small neutral amino acid transporter SnatA (MarC family)
VNSFHIVPLAFVMVAGPQIISSFFFATSERWQSTSIAYVAGAAISITIIVGLAYFLGGSWLQREGNTAIYYIVLALLLVAMVSTFIKRKNPAPPRWMLKLQSARPKFAFILGALLLGIFPSDLVTSIAVGGYLAANSDVLWHYVGFLLVTLLLLALPALAVLLMGERAERVLPKVRDWTVKNSWIVNEVVLVLFSAIVFKNIAVA